jgi:RNA-binding protein YhbY
MKGFAQQHKRHLRKLAPDLRPMIIVGAGGLSDPVMAEIDLAIETHPQR